MKIYVKLEPSSSGVVAISTKSVPGDIDTVAEMTGPIDPALMDGYELKYNAEIGANEISFSVQRYRQVKAREAEKAAQAAESEALSQAMEKVALTGASDDEALKMVGKYPEWMPGQMYATGDRIRFDGGFYKVVQGHTSQDGWTPIEVRALYTCLSEPAEEWPEFVHPTGAHDVYMAGDKITFKDDHYTCTMDYTAHSPEEYPVAWTKAE